MFEILKINNEFACFIFTRTITIRFSQFFYSELVYVF